MKRFISIFTAFAVMALVFAGCSNSTNGKTPEPEPKDPVVTGISLRIAQVGGTPSSIKPPLLAPGAVRTVTASVEVTGDASKDYTIALEDWDDEGTATPSAATLVAVANSNPKAYTLTVNSDAVSDADQVRIVATSVGENADGEKVSAEWIIPIKEDNTEIPITAWELLLHTAVRDDYGALDTATSTALGTASAGKRYTIQNNESGANFDNDNVKTKPDGTVPGPTETTYETDFLYSTYKDSTFVYLNKAFTWTGQPFGVSMRVKLTGAGAGSLGTPDSLANGFFVGAFSDPKDFKAGLTELYFGGMRVSTSGQISRQVSRQGQSGITPSAAALTPANDSGLGRQHDSNVAKVEGFADQEYIYKVYSAETGVYKLEVWTPDGELLIGEYEVGKTANTLTSYLTEGTNPAYLGIAVTYATVEISDIKIWEGSVEWEDDAVKGAAIEPVVLRSTTIGPEVNPGSDFNYNGVLATFDPHQLEVTTIPRTAKRLATVAWTIESDNSVGESAEVSTGGLVTITEISEVEVKATLTGNLDTTTNAGSGEAVYKFNVIDTPPVVAELTVAPIAGYTAAVEAGNGTYTGDSTILKIDTYTANAILGNVVWRVTGADDAATTAVTLTPTSEDNGMTVTLTAQTADLSADTSVKVYVSSPNGENGQPFESTAFVVQVKKWNNKKVYNFSDAVYATIPGGTAWDTYSNQIGGLFFSGNFPAAPIIDNPSQITGGSATIDSMVFSKALSTGGASMNGAGNAITNGRRVVVPLQGPAKVTLYGFTNDAANRYAAFNNSRTDIPTLTEAIPNSAIIGTASPTIATGTVVCANNMANGSLNAQARINGFAVLTNRTEVVTEALPAGYFNSTTQGSHEVVLWAQNSVCYWGIVVEYE